MLSLARVPGPLTGRIGSETLANQAAVEPCSLQNTAFQKAEKLTYKIYYNLNFMWVPAGEAVFTVDEDEHQYHYVARGRTYGSYEWFFKVKDDYESWADKNTLFPTYSTRSVREGGYSKYEKVLYKQADRQTTVWAARKKDDPETESAHTVADCLHDIVSLMYYLRNLDFSSKKPGDVASMRLYMDAEEFPLQLKFEGKRDRKKVYGMGHYRCLEFEPQLIAGNVFKEGDKMRVWVGDDANRVPLLIESPVSVGSVKMVLKEYWGLRHPFTAKVD